MNPELKAKWIADLRANGPLQGKKYLRTVDEKYCCLGRVRVVTNLPWDKLFDLKDDSKVYATSHGLYSRLDEDELKMIGLTEVQQGMLIKMNDDDNKTFADIADWIEENL